MKTRRLLSIGAAWIGAFFLIAMVALSFQVRQVASQGPDESQIEEDLARAAEQNGIIQQEITVNPDAFGAGGTYSLFAGVSDSAIWQVQIDVTSNAFLNAFTGTQVWGAAYDTNNDLLYFNNGSTLYEWPLAGTPNNLGIMVNGAGSSQALVSLAYYNGTLYGTKNIAPEAIHIVNPATLVVTPVVTYASTHDIGGLAVDPDTGVFYGTDDSTNSLVTIANDGTVTQVTAYPAGQTDIDGLAIGDGKAYLVIDEPGFIYVYDLIGNAYEAPLNNPWPSAETFSGGAWIENALANPPAINLDKTVGTDINSCATTNAITVTNGTQVTYCYNITNTGDTTLTVHDLVDSELGSLLNGFSYSLSAGSSVFITESATIYGETTNTATWTACNVRIPDLEGVDCTNVNAYDIVSDTDQATVYIWPASIDLIKTVGTDPNACAATDAIAVATGTDVTYCYNVTNTSNVTLTIHDLLDDQLGLILGGLSYPLSPGASVFVTATTTILTDTVNTATWTSCNVPPPLQGTGCDAIGAFDIVSATNTASVTVFTVNPSISLEKTVGTDNSVCAATDNITVGAGTEVYYCYTVTNTGDVTFTYHDLDDDILGNILTGLPYSLGPGESTSVYPVSATISGSVTNVATWTAYIDAGIFVTATDTATVSEGPTAVSLNTFGGRANALTLPIMVSLLAFLVMAAGFLIRRANPVTREA